MWQRRLPGLSKTRLRLLLLVFFCALVLPTAILIKQAYSQLKWEAFHHYRQQAEELVARIDQRYAELIATENARAFTDYSFLNVAGTNQNNYLQRSPLSVFPLHSNIPGNLGYFQIDYQGRFSSPLLPEDQRPSSVGLSAEEYQQRQQAREQIYKILSENRLLSPLRAKQKQSLRQAKPAVSPPARLAVPKPQVAEAELSTAPGVEADKETVINDRRHDQSLASAPQPAAEQKQLAEPVTSQRGFDQLQEESQNWSSSGQTFSKGLGRVEDLKLEQRYQQKLQQQKKKQETERTAKQDYKRQLRKERNLLPAEQAALPAMLSDLGASKSELRIKMFESEVDAFEFSLLESGHFVLYRKVWRDGQRYIQGLLLEPGAFIDGVIRKAFYDTAVSQTSNLAVAYQGNVLSALGSRHSRNYLSSTAELQGTLLLQDRLTAALQRMELIFSISQLPAGPGGQVIIWSSIVLLIILCSGFVVLYRLGVSQIQLARQQQDFVSAVSHELKTPLTSIRMYGEMLREGWAPEEKRHSYYDFIYTESERLSRLINNVLQLARLTRNALKVELKPCTVQQLMDTVRSKVSSQVERAGFQLQLNCDQRLMAEQIEVDADYFSQIMINLVDNALKFAGKAEQRQIDIGCEKVAEQYIQFSVRDYGPGVARDQMKKIFRLFYRSENELTRETVGTGIGLALVNQLAQAMQASVDVVSCEPGVEFRLRFPRCQL